MITAATYYHKYIDLVKDQSIKKALKSKGKEFIEMLQGLPDEMWNHRYAEGKWSVKEVVQHVCDTERVFAYRALRIGRGDQTPLPGFEQNDYVTNTLSSSDRSAKSMIKEFKAVRKASVTLLAQFNDEELKREGAASGNAVSVEALGYMIAGHGLHHKRVIEERYLVQSQ